MKYLLIVPRIDLGLVALLDLVLDEVLQRLHRICAVLAGIDNVAYGGLLPNRYAVDAPPPLTGRVVLNVN